MDSIQLPPPIILVCPSLRYKCSSRTNYDRHAKFKIVDSPHYYPFAVPESSLPYSYFGHLLNPLYCALQVCNSERLWDEKELEEEPEEEYENLNSFEVISAGIIQHFSHSHHMKFEKTTTDIMYDERCHACVLPFYGGDIYKYMCSKAVESISIDVRCAAISEPFDHQCHPHPLFLSNEHGRYRPCSMCGKETLQTLNCIECDFFLCFYCATLPYKVRYEHDEHLLILTYEENAVGSLLDGENQVGMRHNNSHDLKLTIIEFRERDKREKEERRRRKLVRLFQDWFWRIKRNLIGLIFCGTLLQSVG
ncbi:BnaC04g13800D [Brassica napus]|uniref:BnaC04g13800D protein n=3 Tax=Brassica TaxID=3705 RepID=A0A078ID50_BRANA|nr:BnaC04g13800D [Brassica napus]VDD07454.1 unnamed protein product [Brassica oleracea]